MNIAMPTFQFKRGGGITYLKHVLPLFSSMKPNHRFIVYAPERHTFLDELELGPNVTVSHTFIPFGLLGRIIYEQLILPRQLARDKIDVLFSTGDITSLFAPCKVVLAVRNPNPYNTHVRWGIEQRVKLTLLRMMTKASIKKSEKTFFVSNDSKERVRRALKVDPDKLTTIYHGINHELFNTQEKSLTEGFKKYDPYILTVSTINPHKNFETLIAAIDMLPEQLNRYNVLIVGRAAVAKYHARLRRLVAQHNLQNRVIFTGPVPFEQLPALYRHAEVFVLPSLLETFGFPLVEAMACGIPVIASDATSNPEILAGAGMLFDTTDPKSLARTIEQVLTNNKIHETMKEKGLTRAQDFSWEKSARAALDLIEGAGITD